MPTIESRIVMDIRYDIATRQYIGQAYDKVTGDVYAEVKQWDDYWLRQNLHDAVSAFMKEWPTCSTNKSESTSVLTKGVLVVSRGELSRHVRFQ